MMEVIISISKYKISLILAIYDFYRKNEQNVLAGIHTKFESCRHTKIPSGAKKCCGTVTRYVGTI